MARPKLPGFQLTKKQVQQMGRRTCYDIVERVGDTLFGIFPEEPICSCCRHNTFVPLSSVYLEPWQEGLMLQIGGTEYRVRNFPAFDRIHGTWVWEMEKQGTEWIPVKPRGRGKKEQKVKPVVTTSMLQSARRTNDAKKQQMSKVLVRGRDGWVFVNQKGKWDLVGGKRILEDATPEDTLRREYREELRVGLPSFLTLGKWETPDFDVFLYYVEDRRFKSVDASLLEGVQLQTFQQAERLYRDKSSSYVIKSNYEQSILSIDSSQLAPYQQKVKERLQRMQKAETLWTNEKVRLPILSYKGKDRCYILPFSSEESASIKKKTTAGLSIKKSLIEVLGLIRASHILGSPVRILYDEAKELPIGHHWRKEIDYQLQAFPCWHPIHLSFLDYKVELRERSAPFLVFNDVSTGEQKVYDLKDGFQVKFLFPDQDNEDIFPLGSWSVEDIPFLNGDEK